MEYLSVCSGIEAATVAWHSLGWEPAAFSEIEPFPCAVLAHHYPKVSNLGDMTKFKEWPDGHINILVGGTPCQSYSVAGLRAGLADPRGDLMLTYLAIANRYQPQWVVWENVPGVLSSGGGRDFGTFLWALGAVGYGWAYRVLDAQYFGVPQRRRRVFVVGYLGDWTRAAAVLFERHSLQGHPPPSREKREGVAATISSSPPSRRNGGSYPTEGHLIAPTISARTKGGGGLGTDFDCDGGLIANAIHASDAQHMVRRDADNLVSYCPDTAHTTTTTHQAKGGDPTTDNYVAHSLRAEGFDASEDGTGRGTPIIPIAFDCKASGQNGFGVGEIASTMRSMGHAGSHQNGGGHQAVAVALRGREGGGTAELSDVPSALRASGGGGGDKAHVLTAMQVRRLTPRECERLQGFPDDYTQVPYRNKPAADGPRYKALGNSMAVPVMRWIGERIQLVDYLTRPE